MSTCLLPAFSLHFVGVMGIVFGVYSVDNRSSDRCASKPRDLCAAYFGVHTRANPMFCSAFTNDRAGGNLLEPARNGDTDPCSIGGTWPADLLSLPLDGRATWFIRIDSRIDRGLNYSACKSLQDALLAGRVIKYTWRPPSDLRDRIGPSSPFISPSVQACFRLNGRLLRWVENVDCSTPLGQKD